MEFFWIILLFALICLSFPDLLFLSFLYLHKVKQVTEEHSPSWWARLTRRSPRLYLSESLPFSCFQIPTLFGSQIFFHEKFWDALSVDEREACVFWFSALRLKSRFLSRLIWPPRVQVIDRDALLMGARTLSLISALEKSESFEKTLASSFGRDFWAGLSLRGPSWVSDWPSPIERASALSREQTRLEAEN